MQLHENQVNHSVILVPVFASCRLEDDERLDALLDQLEKRMPAPAGAASSGAAANRQQSAPAAGRRSGGAAAGGSKQQGARPKQQQQQRGLGLRGVAGAGQGVRPAARDQRAANAAGRLAAAAAVAAEDSGGFDDMADGYESDTGVSSSSGTVPGSVKSGLAAELRGVRQQLQQLEVRASNKARRALAGLPASSSGGGGGRVAGARRAVA